MGRSSPIYNYFALSGATLCGLKSPFPVPLKLLSAGVNNMSCALIKSVSDAHTAKHTEAVPNSEWPMSNVGSSKKYKMGVKEKIEIG